MQQLHNMYRQMDYDYKHHDTHTTHKMLMINYQFLPRKRKVKTSCSSHSSSSFTLYTSDRGAVSYYYIQAKHYDTHTHTHTHTYTHTLSSYFLFYTIALLNLHRYVLWNFNLCLTKSMSMIDIDGQSHINNPPRLKIIHSLLSFHLSLCS
jgi:hypothetical protein